MMEISAQQTTLTLSNNQLGNVTLKDLSDAGSPLEFGELEPYSIETDLNRNFVIGHRPITPTFTIHVIPTSKTDRTLRAFLHSSVLGTKGGVSKGITHVHIDTATFRFGYTGKSGSRTPYEVTFYDGYLVGGSSALSISGEGRFQSVAYRFVFKSTNKSGYEAADEVKIYAKNEKFEGLYFARISARSSERLISHPIETGGVIYDQKYREPEHIDVTVKIPLTAPTSDGKSVYDIADTVSELKKMLNDREVTGSGQYCTPYKIVTKSETYYNLSLISISHDESPDVYDLIEYRLTFQELMFSNMDGKTTPSDPSNQETNPTQPKSTQDSRP